MGRRDVDEFNFIDQYIIAIYFVTTTLSTCGFGDISATKDDSVESFEILVLQFVGLLFYSYTINQIQNMMLTSTINPGDYANLMSEVVENLTVKAVKTLPKEIKISG